MANEKEVKEFRDIYGKYVKREGSNELLEWIEQSDFYTAPASTRFHGNYEGGLLRHSLNVYGCLRAELERLKLLGDEEGQYSEETVAITALLHDLTKVGTYKLGTRNVKNEATGQWEKRPVYGYERSEVLGDHGDESVFRIMKFMRLKDEEIMAIRAHMGGFDAAAKGGSNYTGEIFEKSKLALLTHLADVKATYLYDKKVEL